jgi:hypothetical protein
MLSSVLDTLRAWPAVRRGALSLLLPPGDAQTALVLDAKVAGALRALGYVVRRSPAHADEASGESELAIVALALPQRAADADGHMALERLQREAQRLTTGGWLLVRAPRHQRERMAAAFLHAGLAQVAQGVSRRSVLTVGQKRPSLTEGSGGRPAVRATSDPSA